MVEPAPANLWPEFKKYEKGESGTIEDNCADVIRGQRLDHAVQDVANGYLRQELGPDFPENEATEQRARLLDLHWGKIEYDAGMLEGLGAAIDNLATTLIERAKKLGESWKGESYDAFSTAIGKICTTLTAYACGATATGIGLRTAMEQARILYENYAQESVSSYLNFDEATVSPPGKWHKVTDNGDITPPGEKDEPYRYNGFALADSCVLGIHDCPKNEDDLRRIITDHYVTERWWRILEIDPCAYSDDHVASSYNAMVEDCDVSRGGIKNQLGLFFIVTENLVHSITEMMDIAVGNLYELANAEALTSLRVIAAGGGQPVDSGDDTGGGGYPGGGGGYPGDSGGGSVGVAEPMQPVEAPADTEPAAVEPAAEPAPDADAAAPQPETVEIKDGDHTISVTSPDGEGRVTVTVEDGTGKTKTYELDFDAASGASPTPPAARTDSGPEGQPAADGAAAEQVPARSDGKCVIQDGDLTITAERPLFAPDSVTITVDDGSGTPTIYTLDFAETDAEEGTAGPGAAPTAGTPGQSGATTQQTPSGTAIPIGEEAAVAEPGQVGGQPATGTPVAGSEAAQPATGTPVTEPATGAGAATPGTAGQVPDTQLTTPQAWTEDQSGSVSGVLVPEQSDGEAGLASAPDAPEPKDQSTGMAGSGLPMMGAPGSGAEPGRAGSGWSVHGDLFDSTEPVYSMHGVLGDDEHEAER